MKKIASLLLAFISVAVLIMPTAAEEGEAAAKPIAKASIIHTGRTFGSLCESDPKNEAFTIGASSVAALKANTPDSLLLDSGDFLYGSIISPEQEIELMNSMGYDAAAFGIADLNIGIEELSALSGMAEFPFFASGLSSNGNSLFDNTKIFDLGGIKVGVFGLIGTSKTDCISCLRDKSIGFFDVTESASESAVALRAMGADIIVAMGSLGAVPESLLFGQVDDIDIFIKTEGVGNITKVGNTEVISSPVDSSLVGIIDITEYEDGSFEISGSYCDSEEISMTELRDRAAEVSKKVTALSGRIYENSIAAAEENTYNMSIDFEEGDIYKGSPFAEFTADALRNISECDIAVFPQKYLAKASLSMLSDGEIYSALAHPYAKIKTSSVSPKKLREILEEALSGVKEGELGEPSRSESDISKYLVPSGFSYVYDPALKEGEKVISIFIDDKMIDLDDDSTALSLAYPAEAADWNGLVDCLPTVKNIPVTLYDSSRRYAEGYTEAKTTERIKYIADESARASINSMVVGVSTVIILLSAAGIAIYFYKKRTQLS